jgi:hypothetical protein
MSEGLHPAGPPLPRTWRREGWVVSTDPTRLDLDAIHGYLARAYWCEGIPRETVERALAHSLNFGVYAVPLAEPPETSSAVSAWSATAAEGDWTQVGFGRVITDYATFGYLADVFVLESHRGHGLSTWLMECVGSHPDLQGFRRWILLTRDAHGIYERFGFTPLATPDRYMERHVPDVYRTAPG